jgi:hypothetical protein
MTSPREVFLIRAAKANDEDEIVFEKPVAKFTELDDGLMEIQPPLRVPKIGVSGARSKGAEKLAKDVFRLAMLVMSPELVVTCEGAVDITQAVELTIDAAVSKETVVAG